MKNWLIGVVLLGLIFAVAYFGWHVDERLSKPPVSTVVDKSAFRDQLNQSIVARYGKDSRLMRGDDEISQAIIDRYCLAESKDGDDFEIDPEDTYKSGWRPWLCGPFPSTYTLKQNSDGTYHIRYDPENLNADGTPKDKWTHKGVRNVGLEDFLDGLKRDRDKQ